MKPIPLTIVHYSEPHPLRTRGGVQTFAQALQSIFERVHYMTPSERDMDKVVRERIPVISESELAIDWPEGFPLIGFLHGVAAIKFKFAKSIPRWLMARDQKRAGHRAKTLWVGNCQWVSRSFEQLYGCRVDHTIYYPVDVDHFDGRLENNGSRLILHDGRTRHKGKREILRLQGMFPQWHFEPLDCPHDQVPERMRKARAFIHLSRYEGNSIVCNEAMAMNLPCLFTRVGLMNDPKRPEDVMVVEPNQVFGNRNGLFAAFSSFAEALERRQFNPRQWILENATIAIAKERWVKTLLAFQSMSGWDLGLNEFETQRMCP